MEVLDSKPSVMVNSTNRENPENDRVLVKRKTLQAVLQQCQRALELLETSGGIDDDDDDADEENGDASDNNNAGESRSGDADEVCSVILFYFFNFLNNYFGFFFGGLVWV